MARYAIIGLGTVLILALWVQGSTCSKQDVTFDKDIDLEPNPNSVSQKVEHGEEGSVKYNANTVVLKGNKQTKMDDHGKPRPPWPPRPGRKRHMRPKASVEETPFIFRPGRSIHEESQVLFHPGRASMTKRQGFIFRPGRREDVPEPHMIFRPGRRDDVPSDDADQFIFRPGREDVPQPQSDIFRPGRRSDIPEAFQFTSVRPGRGGYKMPWTYTGKSLNSHISQKSHTFRQKAIPAETKRSEQSKE